MICKIYKYEIKHLSVDIKLPLGFKILKIKAIRNKIYLWAEIDIEESNTQTINIVGLMTGEEYLNDGLVYLDTVFLENGLVVHIHRFIDD